MGLEALDEELIQAQMAQHMHVSDIEELPKDGSVAWLLVQFGADTEEDSVSTAREFATADDLAGVVPPPRRHGEPVRNRGRGRRAAGAAPGRGHEDGPRCLLRPRRATWPGPGPAHRQGGGAALPAVAAVAAAAVLAARRPSAPAARTRPRGARYLAGTLRSR
jgi:hypothetical protein